MPQRTITILFLLLFGTLLHAAPDFDRVMALDKAPDGVVFEIVESDDDALNWAIPKTVAMIEQLRRRFPGLPVAVVSHGSEMFALKREYAQAFKPVHETVRSLTREQDVDVHVCGTHASWHTRRTWVFGKARCVSRVRGQGAATSNSTPIGRSCNAVIGRGRRALQPKIHMRRVFNADESDFPDYVDVAPVGPTQIGQYRELGYYLIRVEQY